jgi:hypothetical protein
MNQTQIKPISGFTFFASPTGGIAVMCGEQSFTLSSAGDAIALIRGLTEVLAQHGYNVDDFLKGRG